MPWYKVYRGKHVWWAEKGTKKPKLIGYAKLRTRNKAMWELRRGATYSYKRMTDAEVRRAGLEKKKKRRRRSRASTGFWGSYRGPFRW